MVPAAAVVAAVGACKQSPEADTSNPITVSVLVRQRVILSTLILGSPRRGALVCQPDGEWWRESHENQEHDENHHPRDGGL